MIYPHRADIEAVLQSCQDPYLPTNLLTTAWVKSLVVDQGQVHLVIVLGYPAEGFKQTLAQTLTNKIAGIAGIQQVRVQVDWRVTAGPVGNQLAPLAGVKNIIAVASGKGGVGKSTTAANIALALSADGARVGILDADIYGPSMGQMLGIPAGQRPDIEEARYFIPITAHGLQVMSMACLATEATPMIWRGPMVSGALKQLLTQTRWHNLDYLIVDMPPGTGDIALTLAQKVPVTGGVIVTTPQDLALIDAKKSIEMFRKVAIPVFGIVENMASYHCPHCGHIDPLFGEGGGHRIAEQYHVGLLGAVPLTATIRAQADSGQPTVVAEPEGTIGTCYQELTRRLAATVSLTTHRQHAAAIIAASSD